MKHVVDYLASIDPVWAAFYATCFTWLVTAAGAALVFLFKTLHRKWLDGMLGFTGGVMIARNTNDQANGQDKKGHQYGLHDTLVKGGPGCQGLFMMFVHTSV